MQWSEKKKIMQWSALPLGSREVVRHFLYLFSLSLSQSLTLVVKILCCPRLLECELSFVVSDNLYNQHHCHCPASVFSSVKGADINRPGLLGLCEHL